MSARIQVCACVCLTTSIRVCLRLLALLMASTQESLILELRSLVGTMHTIGFHSKFDVQVGFSNPKRFMNAEVRENFYSFLACVFVFHQLDLSQ